MENKRMSTDILSEVMIELAAIAARTAHETNRAYCQYIGDASQPSWKDSPMWQKDSAIHGVLNIIHNKNTTPEQSHESWMSEKLELGWVYGPVKNAEEKTHPCLVSYGDLSGDQKIKDVLFNAVVRGVLGGDYIKE